MRLFDTHCHFETTDEATIRATLERAKAAGVEALMAVGGSDALNAAALAAQRVACPCGEKLGSKGEELGMKDNLAASHSSLLAPHSGALPANGSHTFYKMCEIGLPRVYVALGYDREQVGKELRITNDELRMADGSPSEKKLPNSAIPHSSLLLPHSPTAVGEIGLDYYYSAETREQQMTLFAAQLELARERDLPVVIHTREADDDTLGLLREIPSRGIIHCYTGTPEAARQFLDLGFYVSISGIVTFRAADNVRAAARVVPDDRILIETDAPFLAPVPMRGKPNEPAFVAHTCAFLAAQRGMSADDFAALTFANAEKVLRG